jgi:hypothetical protein
LAKIHNRLCLSLTRLFDNRRRYNQCCGAEIKFPSGARAKIMNCVSGYFPFIKDLKKFYRKNSWLQKIFLKIVTILNFNHIRVKHTGTPIHVKKSTNTRVKK